MSEKNYSEKFIISSGEFHKMDLEEKIKKITGSFQVPPGKAESEVLDSIFQKIKDKDSVKIVRFWRYLQAAAAIILLLLGIYTINSIYSHEKVETEFAEHKDITLPDGTEVALNAGSEIVWSNNNFEKSRELKLKGEAYFNVVKGKEFLIETRNGTVEILGTQLDVFSRDNKFRVSCLKGKVKVNSGDEEQIIVPGEVAELSDEGLSKFTKKNIKRTVSWQNI